MGSLNSRLGLKLGGEHELESWLLGLSKQRLRGPKEGSYNSRRLHAHSGTLLDLFQGQSV